MRCNRTDLRLIRQRWICVSCANREYEWRNQRNAKGMAPPMFQPLTAFSIATETATGDVVHHAIEARHAAEAVGVVAHQRLAAGVRLSARRPGGTTWSTQHNRFVVACSACGHAGLLERAMRETLRHHCPACQGAPSGPGWATARPGAPVTLMLAPVLATWLELTGQGAPVQWASTQFGCAACCTSVLQVRATAEGHVEARCPACGATHAH
jgi:hypothetical protein